MKLWLKFRDFWRSFDRVSDFSLLIARADLRSVFPGKTVRHRGGRSAQESADSPPTADGPPKRARTVRHCADFRPAWFLGLLGCIRGLLALFLGSVGPL